MPRVLVTEPLAESGLALLREAGHDVDVQLGLSPDELLSAIKGASALIVRSATKVTADVFDALCSVRPYKPAWPIERAHDEILRGGGSQFDPACIAAFEARWPEIAAIVGGEIAPMASSAR